MNAKTKRLVTCFTRAFVVVSCALGFPSSVAAHEAAYSGSAFTVQQTPTTKGFPEYRNFSADFVSYVNHAVEKLMLCYNITGLSLAVIDRRKTNATNNVVLKFTRGYGVKDLRTKAPVDENTKFAIGSVTKSLTAATFASLTANPNASFDYDTLVGPILRQKFNTTLSNSDEHFNAYGNFRDLLSHRTGIMGLLGPILTGSELTVNEMLKALNTLPALPHEYGGGFRESFVYNNWMYALVGALMANASQRSWKSLVQKTILQPWSIAANFLHDLKAEDNFALPVYLFANASINGSMYDYYYKQYNLKMVQEWLGRNEILNPAAGIAASAEDMALYWKAIIHNNKIIQHSPTEEEGRRWLICLTTLAARYIEFWNVAGFSTIPPSAVVELNNPQTTMNNSSAGFRPPKYNYWDVSEYYTAFGLERGIHNDSLKFSHSGGVRSYISQFAAFMAPYPQYGVFISTNGPGGLLANTAVTVVEQAVLEAIVTDGHPLEWTLENLCSAFPVNLSSLVPRPKPLNTNVLLGNASAYTGRYKHPMMGVVQITAYNTTHLRWALGTVGTGFMVRSVRDDLWQFDMNFDGGMEWAQSALDFTAESMNRTALFTGPAEGNQSAKSVILSFQGGTSVLGEQLPDEYQPVFERESN